jgi:phage I-like protein
VKLSPYFEGDYWEQEGKAWKKYRQVVTREHGERIAAAFNALAAQMGANFRGLPIYAGHPDARPDRWPDESRLGGIMAVEAREDGIYVKPAWNARGEENRREGYLVFPSPAWPYDEQAKRTSGRIEPIELRSVGMTNTPRIREVPAWTNADPSPDQPPTNQNDTNMDLKQLAELIGLDPATATEDSIVAAIKALLEKCAAATNEKTEATRKMEEEKGKAIAANALVEKFRGIAINSLKTEAINGGKVTAAEWPSFETRLATNFDEVATEIRGKSGKLPTDSLRITKQAGDLTTPGARQIAFNAAIEPHIQKGLSIDDAIAAVRATTEGAALLKAMEDASIAATT